MNPPLEFARGPKFLVTLQVEKLNIYLLLAKKKDKIKFFIALKMIIFNSELMNIIAKLSASESSGKRQKIVLFYFVSFFTMIPFG